MSARIRILAVVTVATAAFLPQTSMGAQKGAHIAMSCAFAVDPFCNRLLAELQAAGHQVDKLPDGADLQAELEAPGAVVQVRQAPWEVVVLVRHDGLLETRTYKPDSKEANPAQLVAVQVAEGLRATFAVRAPEVAPPKEEVPDDPKAPEPRPKPDAGAEQKVEPAPQPPPKALRLASRPTGRSEQQLDLETYFATTGFQLLMNASVFGSVALLVAIGIASGSSVPWAIVAFGTAIAPITLALPSSHLAWRLSTRDPEQRPAFSKGFLAGSLASTVLVGGTMALLVPALSGSGVGFLWSSIGLYAASAFLIPAAEVLTLKSTAVQVVAVPMAIRGGGGVGLGGMF